MADLRTSATGEERRAKLRTFLVRCRSRLSPANAGVPATERRRVTGLRRSEVAELTGVSTDWYRWFESGRPIRVSTPFLARLSKVLRLSAADQRVLYHLAIPELYEADIAQQNLWRHLPLSSPVRSFDEVGAAARHFAIARDQFLSGAITVPSGVRPRIVKSWKRSMALGADANLEIASPQAIASDDDLAVLRSASQPLLDAAGPILSQLEQMLADSGYAIVTSNACGRVVEISGEREILRTLARINFVPGCDLSESTCGTNAVGTALADGRPLQLMAAENYCEAGGNLTCTAAPIRDPSTFGIVGVLDVTADYRRLHPEILSLVIQCALEIEERLAAEKARP